MNTNEFNVNVEQLSPETETISAVNLILELIRDVKVVSWSHLEIMSTLYGFDIDKEIFINLLDYLSMNYVYSFLEKSIENNEHCIRFFESFEVIEKIFSYEDKKIWRMGENNFDYKTIEFHCVDFLGSIELKHPEFFLKYFLKSNSNNCIGKIRNGYINFLNLVIRRTKIRATKNKSYSRFINRLNNIYYKYNNISMFLN